MRRAHNAITHGPLNCFCPENSLNSRDFDETDTPCRKALTHIRAHTHTHKHAKRRSLSSDPITCYITLMKHMSCIRHISHDQSASECDFLYLTHTNVWLCWNTLDKEMSTTTNTAAFQTVTPSPEYAGRSHMARIYAAAARKHALQMSAATCNVELNRCHRACFCADLHF